MLTRVLLCLAQSKAGAQVKDLMNRLNNAVKQRNAAREEALLASEKLKVGHGVDCHDLQPRMLAEVLRYEGFLCGTLPLAPMAFTARLCCTGAEARGGPGVGAAGTGRTRA